MAEKVTVKSGQSLSSIAKANNTTVAALKEANPKLTTDPKYQGGSTLFSGTKLNIPAANQVASTPTRTPTSGAAPVMPGLETSFTTPAPEISTQFVGPIPVGATRTTTGYVTAEGKTVTETAPFRVDESGNIVPYGVKDVEQPKDSFFFTDPETGQRYTFKTAAELNAFILSWSSGAAGRATKAAADAAATAAKAAADKLAAEKLAEKQATKQKASDKLSALFASYGLDTLAPFINEKIMADTSEEMLMLELYARPEYKKRFPGMEKLRGKGRTITEAEYMGIEKQMTQTARFFDVPKGFYDGAEDFGTLIGNEVSAKEFQDRLQVGQDLARSLNPQVRQALSSMYQVGEGGITAYVLDSEKALSLIQKQAKASQFVGLARTSGFALKDLTAASAETIAGSEPYAKLTENQLQQALGQAGELRRTQSRLAGIENQAYNEQEALNAVIVGSPEALLASQQRAARETARFSARSGLTATSLRSTEIGNI
jgi:hypothetical protein